MAKILQLEFKSIAIRIFLYIRFYKIHSNKLKIFITFTVIVEKNDICVEIHDGYRLSVLLYFVYFTTSRIINAGIVKWA